MHHHISSKTAKALVTTAVLVSTFGACTAAIPNAPVTATPTPGATARADTPDKFAGLETQYDARLGVYAIDTATGAELSWRSHERFPFASTSKALSAAALLDKVGVAGLSTPIPIDADSIVNYAPETEQHVGDTMTLREIAAASVQQSDNTAANLVVDRLGGTAAFDEALSRIGDRTTEIDRTEPSLNEATPGDLKDTSTPKALATDLRSYVLGNTLSTEERKLLKKWLTDHTLGDTLIRAGVPDEWTVGNKSGAAAWGTRNDIAVIWPSSSPPIVIAVMSSRSHRDASYDDALISDAAQMAVNELR